MQKSIVLKKCGLYTMVRHILLKNPRSIKIQKDKKLLLFDFTSLFKEINLTYETLSYIDNPEMI